MKEILRDSVYNIYIKTVLLLSLWSTLFLKKLNWNDKNKKITIPLHKISSASEFPNKTRKRTYKRYGKKSITLVVQEINLVHKDKKVSKTIKLTSKMNVLEVVHNLQLFMLLLSITRCIRRRELSMFSPSRCLITPSYHKNKSNPRFLSETVS